MEAFRNEPGAGDVLVLGVSLDTEQADQIGNDSRYELANALDLIAEDANNPAALRWLAASAIQRCIDLESFVRVDAKTAEEARQHAIDFQNWAARQSLSWGELAEWQGHFEKLAEKFDLTDEFKENGIL